MPMMSFLKFLGRTTGPGLVLSLALTVIEYLVNDE